MRVLAKGANCRPLVAAGLSRASVHQIGVLTRVPMSQEPCYMSNLPGSRTESI